jgi:hypothetical protein
MLVGYNTNISYKGTVYHIQTEDSGIKNPVIITLLYYKGTILSSKKISYANFAAAPDYKDKVREFMKEQHKAMIRELIAGRHTQEESALHPVPEVGTVTSEQPAIVSPALPAEEEPSGPEADRTQISKSLDDILLDYILKEKDKQ